MRFSEYIKDKILICLLHLLCMILLMGFFYITGYNRNAAALILIFWWIILGIWIVTGYYRRKKYFDRAEYILENVDQRYAWRIAASFTISGRSDLPGVDQTIE